MRSLTKTSQFVLAAGACVGALAFLPRSALAQTYTLTLSGPASAVVGQAFAMTASGTDPTDQGALYLEVDAIPPNVTTTCPTSYLAGSQLAAGTGGDLVALSDRETFDGAGNFSMPVGYTAKMPLGQWLLCAYTDDGATNTLAIASLQVNIKAQGSGSPGPVSKPANLKRPRVTRSGNKLSCSRGTWSNNPTGYSYRWLVNGKTKPGAHGKKLSITRKLHGHSVQCRVSASNAGGISSVVSHPFAVH